MAPTVKDTATIARRDGGHALAQSQKVRRQEDDTESEEGSLAPGSTGADMIHQLICKSDLMGNMKVKIDVLRRDEIR